LTFWKAIILGIVQGLTEFLPISSSGHLVLAQHFLNVTEPPLFFDIMLHLGTLGAVLIAFRRDIRDVFLAIFGRNTANYTKKSGRMFALFIIIGSVPTIFIALILEKFVKELFVSPLPVSVMLIITGVILWLSGRFRSANPVYRGINTARALIIGTAQGIAALPGISRSGATISTALMCGMSGEEAARYSLLLSVPAIIGATILELKDVASIDIPVWAIIGGTLMAFVVGYLAIKFLLGTLRRGQFSKFAYYCWGIGTLAILVYVVK